MEQKEDIIIEINSQLKVKVCYVDPKYFSSPCDKCCFHRAPLGCIIRDDIKEIDCIGYTDNSYFVIIND